MLTSNDNYNIPNTSYVNKDFQTIYPELLNIIKQLTYRWDPTITDESDPLIVLTKLNALIADKANYNIDKNILETSPLTVAQIENARPLFEQLGYNMKWYRAAETEISLKWKDDIIRGDVDNKNYKNVYTIPIFTTFSDSNGEYVYTLTRDTQVTVDTSIATGNALQGTPVNLKVGDSDIISFVNLDVNNRIYFPDYNVAENGIFITTVQDNNQTDYDEWLKVDNLFVQNLGTKVYKFGMDKRQRYCYIEFPQDIASLMGAGLKITYIKTDGYNGNIGPNTLSQIFADVEAIGKNPYGNEITYNFTKDNLYVTNLLGSTGGADPETIADAYRNYKKIAGTFNTLVSLRDYINYFIRTESVSNCFVCDRMNDVQTAYKVMNYNNGLYQKITQWEEKPVGNGETEEDRLEPFDLKLYALQWVDSVDSVTNYSSSFNILPYYSENVETYTDCYPEYFIVDPDYGVLSQEDTDNGVQSVRHICHDFIPQQSEKILMLKNKYPLSIKIVPQYKLTDVQTKEVKENIIKALIKELNSKKINFGESPEYEFVYKTIQNSDPRIKATVLDTFSYYTFASYYEKDMGQTPVKYTLKEICVSDETPYIQGYYNQTTESFYSKEGTTDNTYLLSPNAGEYCLDKSTQNIYVSKIDRTNVTTYELYSEKRNDFRREIYAKAILNGNTPIYKEDEFFYQPGQDEISTTYDVKSIYPYTSVVVAKEGEKHVDTAVGNTITIVGEYLPGSFYAEKEVESEGNIIKTMWFDTCDIHINTNNSNSLSSKISKITVTNGVYEQSSDNIYITITYGPSNCIATVQDSNLDGSKYIYTTCVPQTRVNKTVNRNSSVTFYTPSLMDDTKYSTYTKILRYKVSHSSTGTTYNHDFQGEDIEKGSFYTVKKDEYFTFLWRLEEDNTFRYRTYKEGDILSCSYNFAEQQVVSNSTDFIDVNILMSNIVNGSSNYDSYLPNITLSSYTYRGNTITNASLTDYISQVLATKSVSLSGGDYIQIKKLNEVIVSDISNKYYWVLNEKRKSSINPDREEYVLFKQGQTDYVLKSNEYFMYYNKQGTALYSVGYGTRIHRENTQDQNDLPEWYVTAIDYNSISDSSTYMDDIMKLNDGNVEVFVSENQMIEAGEEAKIGITLKSVGDSNTNGIRYGIFTKDGYIIAAENGRINIPDVEDGEQNTEYIFEDIVNSLYPSSPYDGDYGYVSSTENALSWSVKMDVDFTCSQGTYNKIEISGTSDTTEEIIYRGANQETQDAIVYQFKKDITFNPNITSQYLTEQTFYINFYSATVPESNRVVYKAIEIKNNNIYYVQENDDEYLAYNSSAQGTKWTTGCQNIILTGGEDLYSDSLGEWLGNTDVSNFKYPYWGAENYKTVVLKNVSENIELENLSDLSNSEILNSLVKRDEDDSPYIVKILESIFIPITDTNIFVDNEKINWYTGSIQDGSNAFSQLSVSLNNESITSLTENQNIEVVSKDDKKLNISGNLMPYIIHDDNTLSDYIPTCILSTPDVQTSGELFRDVTYKETSGETKYTKMYFYKNKLPLTDAEVYSYISGASEMTVNIPASGSGQYMSKEIYINLPQTDIGEYIFNVTVSGLPKEVTAQDEESPDKYIQFSNNIYETKYLGRNPNMSLITKNKRYSFVYAQGTGDNISINIHNIPECILTIQFSKMYPISKPDFMESTNEFDEILKKVAQLDHNQKFDYTYSIPDTEYIENPLSSISFTDGSHPYNKFTISQIYQIDTSVTNKII